MSRSLSRQKVMQFLYRIDILNDTSCEIEEEDLSEFSEEEKKYIKRIYNLTIKNLPLIDSYIKKYSIGWELERIPSVDKSILRVSLCELLFEKDTPPAVIINEAVRMGKKYSSAVSYQFINGLLGNVIKFLK